MFASLIAGTRLSARKLRSGPARGLVPLVVRVAARPSPRRRKLVLGSVSALAPRYERPLPSGALKASLPITLHSHLLDNGLQRLRLAIEDESGKEEARATVDLDVSNTGPVAGAVRHSLESRGTPLCVEGSIDSSLYAMGERELQPWFEQPDWERRLAARRGEAALAAEEHDVLARFARDGYVLLPLRVEPTLLETIDRDLRNAIATGMHGYAYGSSDRIRNLHLYYRGFHALWRHAEVLRWLSLIFEVPARPAQTLTYVFGSEQGAHQDTIHLTPFPAGYMCGVWTALEDVRPDSGELVLYPGSHRLPRVYMDGSGCAKVTGDDWSEFGRRIVPRWERLIADAGLEGVAHRPRRGEVLVWHENLMHGGSRRTDRSLTRRSVVGHYFADGAVAFFDSSGEAATLA